MKKAMLLVMGVFILASCLDKEDKIGKWDDIIELSTRYVDLEAGTDSVIITTGGDWWWIDGISFGDSSYRYYNRHDINLESSSYFIKEEDFIIERRDKNTLFVKMHTNNTGLERRMDITLEAGDYFDHVSIVQAAN